MQKTGDFTVQRARQARLTIICFAVLALVMVMLFVLNIVAGSVNVLGEDIFASDIVMKIRLPRALMAAILGGSLAVSGFLLQTYFANPLAGPYVLGISSAAKAAVALVMIVFLGNGFRINSLHLIAAAFIGALSATAVILVIAKRISHMASLLLAGIMIGYICSAVCDFLVTFANDSDIVNLHDWSKGSFSGSDMDDVMVAAVICAASVAVVMFLTRDISALRLGESYARSVGVDIITVRRIVICISALLSATVTAFAGPVSFVGIAVPVLVRRLFATSEPAVIVPASFMGGAVFCLLCDFISRMAFSPRELSISSVTALLGAPVVIAALLKKNDRFY